MIKVSSNYAHVLFDQGAIYSFISANFIWRNSKILPVPLEFDLRVSTFNGDIIVEDSICKSCTLNIGDREMMVDLLVLEMRDFDIILSMDWAYHATIDCFKKIVNFYILDQSEFSFLGSGSIFVLKLVSTLQARKLQGRDVKDI